LNGLQKALLGPAANLQAHPQVGSNTANPYQSTADWLMLLPEPDAAHNLSSASITPRLQPRRAGITEHRPRTFNPQVIDIENLACSCFAKFAALCAHETSRQSHHLATSGRPQKRRLS
jgi:hypothetical protein